jgi:group I intron endonuclease
MNKNPTIGVYMIRNTVNGKRYFGSSRRCKDRLSGHRGDLRRGDHTNALLLQEWQAYGEAAFEFAVVAEVPDIRDARRIENELIEQHNTTDTRYGYNQMMRGRWSTAARLRNTEKKLINKGKYRLLPDVSLEDPMSQVFVQTAKKGHHRKR